jgi:uncharacterized membrane protein YccC
VIGRLRAPTVADAQLLVRITLAGTLAWWLSTLLGQPRPLFAALVPLVAMLGDPYAAFNVSLARVLGVLVGVLLGIGLIHVSPGSSTVLVALLFVTSLALGLVIRIGGQPNNQIAISALFMLYLGEATKAESVGFARVWETALGAGVSLVVSMLLWPPDPLAETRRRLGVLTRWTHDDLRATADLLERGSADDGERLLEDVRGRSREAVRFVLELDRGQRALSWNPLRRRDRGPYATERTRIALAARAYRHARTLLRYVVDATAQGAPLPSRGVAGAIRLVADATVAAVGPEPARARPLLARADAVLDRTPAVSPQEQGITAKLRQLSADLDAAGERTRRPAAEPVDVSP